MSEPEPSTRQKVLFLGGQARSGSTLLDRAVGSLDGFCSAGEIRYLWDRGLKENQRCGCGSPVLECAFWTAVGERAFGGWDRIALDEVLALRADVDRLPRMPLLAVPRMSAAFEIRLSRYGEYLGRVFSAISDESGESVVIDSSMSPPHGMVLRSIASIDLHLVHLVRDARGVAYSSGKVVERPEVTERIDHMPTYPAWAAGARWTGANLTYETLARRMPSLRVAYEDFVRHPDDTMRSVAALMDIALAPDALAFLGEGSIELTSSHTVAGNPMRFQNGTLPLRLDEAWRRGMRPLDRRLVTAIAWPLQRRYRYGRHDDAFPDV